MDLFRVETLPGVPVNPVNLGESSSVSVNDRASQTTIPFVLSSSENNCKAKTTAVDGLQRPPIRLDRSIFGITVILSTILDFLKMTDLVCIMSDFDFAGQFSQEDVMQKITAQLHRIDPGYKVYLTGHSNMQTSLSKVFLACDNKETPYLCTLYGHYFRGKYWYWNTNLYLFLYLADPNIVKAIITIYNLTLSIKELVRFFSGVNSLTFSDGTCIIAFFAKCSGLSARKVASILFSATKNDEMRCVLLVNKMFIPTEWTQFPAVFLSCITVKEKRPQDFMLLPGICPIETMFDFAMQLFDETFPLHLNRKKAYFDRILSIVLQKQLPHTVKLDLIEKFSLSLSLKTVIFLSQDENTNGFPSQFLKQPHEMQRSYVDKMPTLCKQVLRISVYHPRKRSETKSVLFKYADVVRRMCNVTHTAKKTHRPKFAKTKYINDLV